MTELMLGFSNVGSLLGAGEKAFFKGQVEKILNVLAMLAPLAIGFWC